MDRDIELLLQNLKKRNIEGEFLSGAAEALEKILQLIPKNATVGFCGSQTLQELDVIAKLEARGNKVFNPYKAGLSRDESMCIRKQASLADYYLASANAISIKGDMVFFSAFGQRIAGIADAKNVIIVAGKNKVVGSLEEALERSRKYVTPLNCRRLKWNTPCLLGGVCKQDLCSFPEYKRMCCQVLIIEAEVLPGRLKVFLVNQALGF